jgi:thioredoxin reductase
MEKYDLIIIGLGPAGYTAAIYAARYRMKVLLIGQTPGGYAGTAHDIRNYPGSSNFWDGFNDENARASSKIRSSN